MTIAKLSHVPKCFGTMKPNCNNRDCVNCDTRYRTECLSIWRMHRIDELEEEIMGSKVFAMKVDAAIDKVGAMLEQRAILINTLADDKRFLRKQLDMACMTLRSIQIIAELDEPDRISSIKVLADGAFYAMGRNQDIEIARITKCQSK